MRVRYVTRASEKLMVRNRIYRTVVDLLQNEKSQDKGQLALGDGI